jgi:hypothetical protein
MNVLDMCRAIGVSAGEPSGTVRGLAGGGRDEIFTTAAAGATE